MTISEQQRQKKLEKKRMKRKLLARSAGASLLARNIAIAYAIYPIYECLATKGMDETGLGTVIWARRIPSGAIAVAAFIVDTFCLGVKNALFKVASAQDYEDRLKPGLGVDQEFENIHPSCARKLIEGALGYAAALGFAPHRDYQEAKGLFGTVEGQACPTSFTYGHDGKPLYIRGPNESLAQAKQIVTQLQKVCGDDNYHYLVGSDGGTRE